MADHEFTFWRDGLPQCCEKPMRPEGPLWFCGPPGCVRFFDPRKPLEKERDRLRTEIAALTAVLAEVKAQQDQSKQRGVCFACNRPLYRLGEAENRHYHRLLDQALDECPNRPFIARFVELVVLGNQPVQYLRQQTEAFRNAFNILANSIPRW